jgi:hypothetical protein
MHNKMWSFKTHLLHSTLGIQFRHHRVHRMSYQQHPKDFYSKTLVAFIHTERLIMHTIITDHENTMCNLTTATTTITITVYE